MKLRVRKIAPFQLGKLLAAVYGLFSLVYFPIMFLISLSASEGKGISFLLTFGMPIFHIVTAFVGGVVGAFFYNIASKRLGGIEIECEKDESDYFI